MRVGNGAVVIALVVVLASFTPSVVGLTQAEVAPNGTPVDSCRTISTPGRYVQTADLESTGDCLVIYVRSGEVIYDGNGYAIEGDGSGTGILVGSTVTIENVDVSEFETGAFFEGSAGGTLSDSDFHSNGLGVSVYEVSSITIENSRIFENERGIRYGSATTGTIVSNTIEENEVGISAFDVSTLDIERNTIAENELGMYFVSLDVDVFENTFEENDVGIRMEAFIFAGHRIIDNDFSENGVGIELLADTDYLTDGVISGNRIVESRDAGIVFGPVDKGRVFHNDIYDNWFENDQNVRFDATVDGDENMNTWNLSATPGPNVVDGPSLGGNYYGTPDGDGFSQTCTDADGDGFCDSPNTLFANNVDELPLVKPADDGGVAFPPGFFVDSDCTGVLTVGSLRAVFEAGFDDGRPTLSAVDFNAGRRSSVELARLVQAATLTNLELSCTVAPVGDGEPSSFDFDLSSFEGREVAVCFEQEEGTVTCFEGPVDEGGWRPDDTDRALPFALSVFGGNGIVDATFFPDGRHDDADSDT